MSAAGAAAPAVPTNPAAPPGGFRLPPSFAIAWVTFLEFWRRWFLLGLLVIGLLPGALATFMPVAVQHGSERVELILLWGLGGVAFGGALGASLMASLQTPMEIEDRRIYGLVCRPVSRWRLMVGKMFGCAGFLFVYAAVCYAALVGMTQYALAGQPDADKYTLTRSAENAILLGVDVLPKHVVPYTGQGPVILPFDFTGNGAIPDWGKSAKPRFRWVLVTCVRSRNGQPDVAHVWDVAAPAFRCKVNGQELPQWEINQDQPVPLPTWTLEPTGHVVLIIPEFIAARRPASKVDLELTLTPGYFQPGDLFCFSDLAVYDTPKPAYDESLKRRIPFVQTIVTISPGQSADYLLARPSEAGPVADESLFVGMVLKSAAVFRDIFALDVSIERFTPEHPAFTVERQARWVVTERKMLWTPLTVTAPIAAPAPSPVASDTPATVGEPVTGTGSDPVFGPLIKADLSGWRVLRLHGVESIQGVRDSGALFQMQCEGDVKFAAVRSNLWMNLVVALGLFFIQWVCLVMIIVAWSGNLSLGIAVLCALILAVSCYGSGSARSVLTEEQRSLQYRQRMHELHPEFEGPTVSPWQIRLNRAMAAIIWTPPDFMQYSPTERVKTQDDLPFSLWSEAVLYLLLLRAVPIALAGLFVFQRREF